MWNDDEKQVWGKVTCPKEKKNATQKNRIKSLACEFRVLCMFEGSKTKYMAFDLFHNVVRRLE